MEDKTERLQIRMPLIQQLTKYAFFLLCLIIFAPRIINILDATESRLAEGGEVSIGPTGLKLGQAPTMPETKLVDVKIEDMPEMPGEVVGSAPTKSPRPATRGLSGGGQIVQQAARDSLEQRPLDFEPQEQPMEEMFYLIHGSKKEKAGEYHVKIRLGAHNENEKKKVQKVVYYLHDSFKDNVREVVSKDNDFELNITAWGQFEIKAHVYVEGLSGPIRLRRFLNF